MKGEIMKRMVWIAIVLALSATVVTAASAVRFISHRGESAIMPENTMTAFRGAIERGAHGFELDAYLTADNEIVCIHDATTKRTTGVELKVADATLAQLKALDAGSWKGTQFAGERIPTLSEALALARDDFEIYVEIKCGVEILPRLIEVMAAEPKATPERVVFICFNANVIKALRQQFPAYRAYWLSGLKVDEKSGELVPSVEKMIATLKDIEASGVNVAHANLNADYVKAVKAAGFSFHTWTVNNLARATELMAMGMETITSDHAASFVEALKPVTPEPVAPPLVHWTFNDGTLKNTGTGGAKYDGTLAGVAAFADDGIEGGGLRFNGTRGYAALNHTFGDQGTVAFWYKPARIYNYNTVLDNSIHADQWEMWIAANTNLHFRLSNADGGTRMTTSWVAKQGSEVNVWHHFAVTWDRHAPSNGLSIYVNGVRQLSASVGVWATPGDTVFFGGGHSGNTPADGVMDDVRVYDSALTAGQIRTVYTEVAAK